MIRDQTHMESVERWAKYVRSNKNWRTLHTEFIDSQFENTYRVINELLKQPNGKEKIKSLYGIKNEKGYPSLFLK
ncbi:MAG TPA: hypothetical protein VJB90_01150 [Candidatus Nanoarchaeia archaeon]|nr:hypothetical protein [Candidatus Nanoarchaeia archaeon]